MTLAELARVADWPAWVQAIGSIAAIFVAIAVAQSERRRKRRDEAAYIRNFLEYFSDLVGSAGSFGSFFGGLLGKDFEPQLSLRERLAFAEDSLAEIERVYRSVERMTKNEKLPIEVWKLFDGFEYICEGTRSVMRRNIENSLSDGEKAKDTMESFEKSCADLQDRISAYLKAAK